MHFIIFSIVTLVLTVCVWQSESNRNCFNAKTCMHNGIERCGEDASGGLRLFLDLCDIHEFNCLQNTTYLVTARKRCNHLDSLYDKNDDNNVDNTNLNPKKKISNKPENLRKSAINRNDKDGDSNRLLLSL